MPRFFVPAYYERGLRYFNENRVTEVRVDGPHHLNASVQGSQDQIYQVEIDLVEKHEKLVGVEGYCSCPIGFNCKHVVASLLTHLDRQKNKQERFGLPSDRWLYKLKAVRSEPSYTPTSAEVLLYVLKKHASPTGNILYVHTVRVRKLKNGGFTDARRYAANPHSLAGYMHEDDKFALLVLQSLRDGSTSVSTELEGTSGAKALQVLMDTGRCHWVDEKGPVLSKAKPVGVNLIWQQADDASQSVCATNVAVDCELLPLEPPFYLNTTSGQCGELECDLPPKVAAALIASPPVQPEDVDKVRAFISGLDAPNIPMPVKPDIRVQDNLCPVPCLRLLNDNEAYSGAPPRHGVAMLSFDYVGLIVSPADPRIDFIRKLDGRYERIIRDREFEKATISRLDELGLIVDFDLDAEHQPELRLEPVHAVNTWVDFMLYHRPQLEGEGWRILVSEDFSFQIDEPEDWYIDVHESGKDWFSLALGIQVDGEPVNLLPFLGNYLGGLNSKQALSELHSLPDDHPLLLTQHNGRLLHIPLARVRHILETLVELLDPEALDVDGRLKLSRYQSARLAELDQGPLELSWAREGKALRQFGERLQTFSGIREIKPPKALKVRLREYQQEGLNWLQFLREYELGGILADDMGLGKTVQTLAHMLVEKQSRRAGSPSLVVAPTSLMINWKREAERFAPSLKVLVLQGIDRRKNFALIPDQDLVLTTYPLLSRDTDVLLAQDWHLAVLDEAQHIKNPHSKAARTAGRLKARHRLCLTGTPMENHLGELWSQFHFLTPGLLGDEKTFRRLFRNPIEKQNDDERQRQLQKRLAPFLLRREKSAVATELPPKTEILSAVELEGPQRDLYETVRVSMHEKVRSAIDARGLARSHLLILDALLKLRQICCHPQLLKMSSARKIKHSAKLNQLMEMLPGMVEEGRRILLFSQFTSMLAIIEQELSAAGIDYVKLTGQTRNRAKPIDAFQSGKVPVFLLSLKAGGSGLNLTAADTVIHYDPWWNPAAENQATDRAYRIGQDKPVFVYKLITTATVEEKIVAMQQRKQALADALFAADGAVGGISIEDLQTLFEPLD